jgi:hypothetical protein
MSTWTIGIYKLKGKQSKWGIRLTIQFSEANASSTYPILTLQRDVGHKIHISCFMNMRRAQRGHVRLNPTPMSWIHIQHRPSSSSCCLWRMVRTRSESLGYFRTHIISQPSSSPAEFVCPWSVLAPVVTTHCPTPRCSRERATHRQTVWGGAPSANGCGSLVSAQPPQTCQMVFSSTRKRHCSVSWVWCVSCILDPVGV